MSFGQNGPKKRRKTLIGFAFVGIVIGMDSSVIFSTLFFYLRDFVKTDKPEMWFGIILASFFISSIVFGLFAGRWLDKTRRVLIYVNFSIFLQAIGLLLYIIPDHPALLLVGRSICGLADPFTSVISGEVIRIYAPDEVNRTIMLLSALYSFGFIIGPLFNFFFTDISFYIGNLKINNLNFIGLFMIGLSSIMFFVANALIHDCSREFDLKEYLQAKSSVQSNPHVDTANSEGTSSSKDCPQVDPNTDIELTPREKYLKSRKEQSSVDTNNENTTKSIPIKVVLTTLLTNRDTMLIILATFCFIYALSSSSGAMPLLTTVVLKFDMKILSYLYSMTGVSDLIFLLFMAKFCTSNRMVYLMTIIAILSLIIMAALMICFKLLERHYTEDMVMLFIFGLLTTFGWTFDEVCIRVMFANMIPSKIQSFAEALRAGVGRIAIVLGSFTTAIIVPSLQYWSAGIIFLCTLLLVGFLIRRKIFLNPVLVDFTIG